MIGAYTINNKELNSVAAKRIRYGIVLYCIVFAIIVATIMLWFNIISNTVVIEIIDKLAGMRVSNYTMSDVGTGLERVRGFDLALKMFLSNPITGIGYLGRQKFMNALAAGSNQIILTVSPLNWFACFGIIYGLLANIGYVRFYSMHIKNIVVKVIIILAIVMLISGQAVNGDYITWFIIIHGLCDRPQRSYGKKIIEK